MLNILKRQNQALPKRLKTVIPERPKTVIPECLSRGSRRGNDFKDSLAIWIPAFAGMTKGFAGMTGGV